MDSSRWWYLLPAPVRAFPADLALVAALALTMIPVATLPVLSETPVRIVLGLPYVLFAPGYALIAALFPEGGGPVAPEGGTSPEKRDRSPVDATGDGGIDGIERVALSFGLSIAVVPLIGLVLNFTPWGIQLVPILLGVGGFTVVASLTAAQRRWALPDEERFRVPFRAWYRSATAELFAPASRTDAVLNVVLALSVALAVGSVGYAVAVPQQGESFTEFYLLTEGPDGELAADDYPTEFSRGDSQSVTVGIGNQEHQARNYTVVVQLQNVSISGNTTTVRERDELGRLQTDLAHNETWTEQYTIEPTLSGTRLRLAFLLYQDSPPGRPTVENAYRETHLWVNVSAT